jgi:hypothetical protein
MEVRPGRTLPHRFWRYLTMKVSRYAVLAFATAVVFGLAMSPVMAQNTTPPSTPTQDTSKDAMKSSSDAMKSSSDSMKSDSMKSDSMKSDSTQSSGTHHKKHKKSTAPASSSSAGH